MTNKSQDNYSNATLDLVNKFVASNQRKRINLLAEIESESLGIFNIGYGLFDQFDNEGDDWETYTDDDEHSNADVVMSHSRHMYHSL